MPVQIDGDIRMFAQNRRRGLRCDRPLQAKPDGLSFARIRHRHDDRFCFQQLADRNRDRTLRHGGKVWKLTLPDLLLTTGFIKLDHQIGLLGHEIRGRVVEGQVGVLADAGESDINRLGGKEHAHFATGLFRIGQTVKQVVIFQPGFIDETIEQIAPE